MKTIFTLMFTLLLPCIVWAGGDVIGYVSQIEGGAFTVDGKQLSKGSEIFQEDVVTTSSNGKVKVRLLEGTELTLGQSSTIALEDFKLEEDKQVLKALKGAFLYVTGKGKKASAKRVIKTEFATVGIRGTTVWGGMLDTTCEVFVIDGEVSVASDGGEVILKPGEGTATASMSTPPTPAKKWPEKKIKKAVATVSFK
ncbi:MAG: FecR domain-containing protein [Alphaproteobacteria bacterium]|nr:FecR domain-containing protein [Alphaproteobacteria bacterium]